MSSCRRTSTAAGSSSDGTMRVFSTIWSTVRLLDPDLRPDLVKPVRPRAPEFFLVQREELGVPSHTRRLAPWSIVRGVCTGGSLSPSSFVQVAPLTSLSSVVSGHRQCHCDGLLLVTPLSTQPPLPCPPRGAPSVASSHALLPVTVHPLKHHQTYVRGQAWVRRLLLLLLNGYIILKE